MRASLFASATVTSRTGRRASTPRTHRPALLSQHVARQTMEVAPSTSSLRISALPAFVIPPKRVLPPVECCRGTRPSQAAAWLGLVPRQHSTGGRTRLGGITKAGNAEIRRLLVLGATSMVWRATCWDSKAGLWVRGVLARRPVRLVTVALANKLARIAWALMTRGEVYQAQGRAPAAAATVA